jgi:hypothetical protein
VNITKIVLATEFNMHNSGRLIWLARNNRVSAFPARARRLLQRGK